MTMVDGTKKIRIALYLRVSSDEQRERQTIKTQEDVLRRWLEQQDAERYEVVGWFRDDGVSGTISFDRRPDGKAIFSLAQAGRIDQVVVTRMDRLGRASIDLLTLRERLEQMHVAIFAVLESVEDPFDYELRAVLAADERRRFLKRSKEGTERAAREGRYMGGIVPLGYIVEGKRPNARLAPSDKIIIWQDWTEADLVRQMYRWLAVDCWSCVRIADHLNALGVPTSYTRDGRLLKDETGRRTRRTENVWRPGHVRNILVNPVYKGTYLYGRRSKKQRELIPSEVPPLVSAELWGAAQDALQANRLIAKHGSRVNLLRSLVFCSLCRLTFCAYSGSRGVVWYRCGGQTKHRGPFGEERCPSRSFRADFLEPIIVADLRRFLLNPGEEIIDVLNSERLESSGSAVEDAERAVIEHALAGIPGQRDRLLEARIHDLISLEELESKFAKLQGEEVRLGARFAEITGNEEAVDEPLSEDLVIEIRRRVEEDEPSAVTWRELASLLVKRVDAKTELLPTGKKKLVFTIHYRFRGVDATSRGTGSSRR